MKFSCEKSLLVDAVMNVSRVIPSKSSIPSLEGIKITAQAGTLILCGYDMEAGIKTSIQANVMEEGEIVLSARLFADMIRKMGDEISVEVGEKYLTEIKSEKTEFTILGIPTDEYPELPSIRKGNGIKIEKLTLKSMIDQTLFAVAVTDTKPVHTGSLFEMKEGRLTLVSVDGYRLAIRNAQISGEEIPSFVVPGKVLAEISKLIRDDDNEALIMISGRHIVFEIGQYSVISRLLEGDFLDYRNSIPPSESTTVIISTRKLLESVERASLLISDRLRSPLRVLFDESGVIKISCSTTIGKFSDEVACKIDGASVEMGFNNKYLLDALKAADTDEVAIKINGPLSPIKILPPTGDDFLFLVLPVRLRNEM